MRSSKCPPWLPDRNRSVNESNLHLFASILPVHADTDHGFNRMGMSPETLQGLGPPVKRPRKLLSLLS